MFSLKHLLLGAVLSVVLIGHSANAGGGSKEFQDQCARSHELVTPPPATPSEPSTCPIVVALSNCSSSLSVSAQASVSALIQVIEQIINTTSLTQTQQVSQVSVEIALFFQLNVDIRMEMQFCSFDGANGVAFGFIRDVIQVGIQIDALTADAQITLDSSGSCPLFVALQSACAQLGDASTTSAINQLIVSITATLQQPGFTNDQLLALISIQFDAFIQANPSMVSFLVDVQIPGFGCVGNLIGVCHEFYLIATVSTQLQGSTVSNCPLLTALNSVVQNTSYDITVRVQINNLITVISANFSATVNVNAKLQCVSAQIYSLLQLEPWIVNILLSIELPGFGDIYDLLSCSHMCTDLNNCPLVPDGLTPGTTTSTGPVTSTPSSPSTSAASTVSGQSTVPPPTTTPVPHISCAQPDLNLLVVGQPGGSCILLQSIISCMGNWTDAEKLSFRSTLKKVKKDLKPPKKAKKDNAKKQSKRGKKAVKHMNKFQHKHPSKKQMLLVCPVMNGTVVLGTIKEFCQCVKPNFKVTSGEKSGEKKG